jgi:hypothetical protein
MQNLPHNAVPFKQNTRPWGDTIPDAIGNEYIAQTDRRHDVIVWRPHADITISHRFWCHGHATLCYWLNDYTIFSGDGMEIVLRDEWLRINKKPNVGDIIVFRALETTAERNAGTILHSARIEFSNQSLGSRTRILLSSKDGAERLRFDLTPEQVLRNYRETAWYEIKKSRCCCCNGDRINKQYYRRIDGAVGVGAFQGMGYIYR